MMYSIQGNLSLFIRVEALSQTNPPGKLTMHLGIMPRKNGQRNARFKEKFRGIITVRNAVPADR